MDAYSSLLADHCLRWPFNEQDSLRKPLSDFNIDNLPEKIMLAAGKILQTKKALNARCNLVIFIVSDKGRFVLKIADGAYRCAQLEFEYNLTCALNASPLNPLIAEPVAFHREASRAFLLQTYIDADPLDTNQLNNESTVKLVARLLRSIHRVPIQAKSYSATLSTQLDLAELSMKRGLLDLEEFTEYDSPEKVLAQLRRNKPDRGHVVVLHGDYRPKNILVAKDKIAGLVDWGLAMSGDPYYDLAIILWCIKDSELKRVFMQEYAPNMSFDQKRLEYFDLLSKFLNV